MIRIKGQVLKLNAANGQIDSTSCVNIGPHSFKVPIEACVLDNSPHVLSVGELCHDGWSLIWDVYKTTAFIYFTRWSGCPSQGEVFRSIFR